MSLSEMPSMVLVFVVAFVILGFGALIVGKVDASTADTAASQVLGNASVGMVDLGAYAPTVAAVVGGALIIGILINAFLKQGI